MIGTACKPATVAEVCECVASLIQSIPQGEPADGYSASLTMDVSSLQPSRGALEAACRRLRTTAMFRPKIPEVLAAVREAGIMYAAALRAIDELPRRISRAEEGRSHGWARRPRIANRKVGASAGRLPKHLRRVTNECDLPAKTQLWLTGWTQTIAGGEFEAEVYRISGEVALKSPEPDAAKAEAYFERALAVARQQQAKSWELRSAMSMARLWRSQGKAQQARELLARVYGWFTEGFDTLDLKEAKALLEELTA
jgi:hypothetical protein